MLCLAHLLDGSVQGNRGHMPYKREGERSNLVCSDASCSVLTVAVQS